MIIYFFYMHNCIYLVLPRSSDFKVEDAFIGCQTDTPAAVIFQATKHCQLQIKECRSAGKVHDVLGSICVDDLKCHGEGSEYWKNAVSKLKWPSKQYICIHWLLCL